MLSTVEVLKQKQLNTFLKFVLLVLRSIRLILRAKRLYYHKILFVVSIHFHLQEGLIIITDKIEKST